MAEELIRVLCDDGIRHWHIMQVVDANRIRRGSIINPAMLHRLAEPYTISVERFAP